MKRLYILIFLLLATAFYEQRRECHACAGSGQGKREVYNS
jgi:hypothetical protein